MTLRIGIVACSAEGAALCYRTLCDEGAAILGPHMHPEVCLHNHPLGEYTKHLRVGAWGAVADLLISSARKLEVMGAELLICPDNAPHQAWQQASDATRVPWLHIAEEVAAEAHRQDLTSLGVLGTRNLMLGPVYETVLERRGLQHTVPPPEDRDLLDHVIFDQLVYGRFGDDTRRYVVAMIRRLAEQGCDGVVLGCSEIPLLLRPDDSPIPALDSTRILARAALRRATADDPVR